MNKEKLWSPAFIGYGVSSAIFYITQYVMIATLPIIITSELSATAFEAGMSMTCFQIGTILCRPLAGRLIDGLDKRKVLLFSTFLFFIIMGLFNFTESLNTIFALRTLHGVMFALGTTVMATLAVLVLPKGKKGEGINMFAIFSNVAMVLGPAIGLYALNAYGSSVLYGLLTGITLIALVASNFKRLPDELAKPKVITKKQWSLSQFIEKRSLPWAMMALFVGFAYAGVLVFIPIELNELNHGEWGSIFFAVFALMIIISRSFIGKLYENKGAAYVVYPGLAFFLIGLIMLGFTNTGEAILLIAPLLGLGYGAVQPAFQALAVQSAPIERAGVATATYFLALDISVGAGSAILAICAVYFGFQDTYKLTAGIVLVGGLLYHFIIAKRYTVKTSTIESES